MTKIVRQKLLKGGSVPLKSTFLGLNMRDCLIIRIIFHIIVALGATIKTRFLIKTRKAAVSDATRVHSMFP